MPITHPEKELDFQLIFNNEIFNISKCLFGLYSRIFRQHPAFVFQKSFDMSENSISIDTFKEFVKACQGHFYTITTSNCFCLLKLSQKWEVVSIKEEIIKFISNINDASADILKLQFYLLQRNTESTNKETDTKWNERAKNEKHSPKKEKSLMDLINDVEDSISKNINFYLDIPLFATLPISSLLRIISKSFSYYKSLSHNQTNENSNTSNDNKNNKKNNNINCHLFLKFLESATNHHKEASRVLIKLIDDYGQFTESELKKLNEVANPFSESDFSNKVISFFKEIDAQNKEIDEFQKELSTIKKQGEKNIKKIEEEVKTLKHSMKKNAKNSPSQSKSLSNLAAEDDDNDETSKSPLTPYSTVMSNSLSNLQLASQAAAPSDSEVESPLNIPTKQKHNLHSKIPVPPYRTQSNPTSDPYLSNYEILESLTSIMNKFNQIKNSNSSCQKSIEFYDQKISEYKEHCEQIISKLTEKEKKAKEKEQEKKNDETKSKSKQKQKPQSQIEKTQTQIDKSDQKSKLKSLSYYTKSTEKVTPEAQSKNSKHGSKESKSKNKDKSKNNDQNLNDINSISVPKTNFQPVKESKLKYSHSVKEPDRVSFTDKDSRKRSFLLAKTTLTSPSSPQQQQSQSATVGSNNSNKQPKTILFNQTDANSFNGLIYYLTTLNASGNLEGIMKIKASSSQYEMSQPINVTKSTKFWLSDDVPNQWILFDFIYRKINVLNYSIKTISYGANSFHMKNWVVEGSNNSNDEDKWVLIDKRENNSQLNDCGVVANFEVSLCKTQFFRYIRLKMIGPNHYDSNVFAMSRIEFYGTLKIDD